MIDDAWRKWMARHAAIFSMLREEDVLMFAEWRNEFESMGFTAEELHAATDYISRESIGLTRWDHLAAIRDFIRKGRHRVVAKPPEHGSERGTCADCGDTGWAGGLPHLSQLTAEGWLPLIDGRPPLTQAAICTCLCGKWQVEAWEGRSSEYKQKYRKPMGLVEYTRLNAMWRAQLRDWRERQAEQHRSEGAAKVADMAAGQKARAALGKLVANAWQMPSRN